MYVIERVCPGCGAPMGAYKTSKASYDESKGRYVGCELVEHCDNEVSFDTSNLTAVKLEAATCRSCHEI